MPEQLRDTEQYRSLAKRPDYGDNDQLTEQKECNPLDMDKGVADDSMRDRIQQISGQSDSDPDRRDND